MTQLLASIVDRFHVAVLYLLLWAQVEMPIGYTGFMCGLFVLLALFGVLVFAAHIREWSAPRPSQGDTQGG
jgi:NADH:ubiquinone oxidoreductase subunit 3 (subunit A)